METNAVSMKAVCMCSVGWATDRQHVGAITYRDTPALMREYSNVQGLATKGKYGEWSLTEGLLFSKGLYHEGAMDLAIENCETFHNKAKLNPDASDSAIF